MKNNKLIIGIVIIVIAVAGYLMFGKGGSIGGGKAFSNEENNINHVFRSGSQAIKVGNYYYIMNKKAFLKVDAKGKIVANIGEAII